MIKPIISSLLSLRGCRHIEQKHIPDDFEYFYTTRKILPVLIDIRERDAFLKSHMINAVNIPARSESFIKELDRVASGVKNTYWLLFIYSKNREDINRIQDKLTEHTSQKRAYRRLGGIYYSQ